MAAPHCLKCGELHLFTDDKCIPSAERIARLKRHVSTLCALLSGVAVNAALDDRAREIRDTIRKELGE